MLRDAGGVAKADGEAKANGAPPPHRGQEGGGGWGKAKTESG